MCRRYLAYFITVVGLCILITGCHRPRPSSANHFPPAKNWSEAMKIRMDVYGPKSQQVLQPYFTKANVPYPPKQIALLIFKNTKTLELWGREDASESWRYIRRFKVMAASGGPGPKLQQGDRQVPEGIYRIIGLNPESHFDLSMQLDYPNAFDKNEAALSGRTNLGNDIFIHGKKLSVGCIALGDRAIEELFPLVYRTGIKNTIVIISPNDLRKASPLLVSEDPSWVPILYHQLTVALQDFVPNMDKKANFVEKITQHSSESTLAVNTFTSTKTTSDHLSSSHPVLNKQTSKASKSDNVDTNINIRMAAKDQKSKKSVESMNNEHLIVPRDIALE